MINDFLKDPDDIDWFYVVWCSKDDGTNDGSANDTGELQGATISTSTWVLDTGITEDASNTDAVTYAGVTYAVDTVAAIKLSSGTNGTNYKATNRITTSDGRTLDHTIIIKVKQL